MMLAFNLPQPIIERRYYGILQHNIDLNGQTHSAIKNLSLIKWHAVTYLVNHLAAPNVLLHGVHIGLLLLALKQFLPATRTNQSPPAPSNRIDGRWPQGLAHLKDVELVG